MNYYHQGQGIRHSVYRNEIGKTKGGEGRRKRRQGEKDGAGLASELHDNPHRLCG